MLLRLGLLRPENTFKIIIIIIDAVPECNITMLQTNYNERRRMDITYVLKTKDGKTSLSTKTAGVS